MWQMHKLGAGELIVATSSPEGITVFFGRRRGAPIVYMILRLDGGELRAFNKGSLPVIRVDGEEVLEFNECMRTQRSLEGMKNIEHAYCFSEDRSVGVCVWSGVEVISPTYPLWKIVHGTNIKIQIAFQSFEVMEYEYALEGLADALLKGFGIRISENTGMQSVGMPSGCWSPFPDVRIDRSAIRSMVEDHWRSFISVAVSNPQIGFHSVQNFDERIKATAALMPTDRTAMYLQAVEEEREILFNEYNRNPDALRRRLGLAPLYARML